MKKIKAIFKRRASHGFTLVEMIVAVALLAVLLGGMMILVAPILESYADDKQFVTAENISTCMVEHITHTLRNSGQVVVVENASYGDTSTNSLVTTKVNAMKKYVDDSNTNYATRALKCISLRYFDGKYYLCNEGFSATGNTLSGNAASTVDALKGKVFSDVLYNDLYMNFDFSMASVATGEKDASGNDKFEVSKHTLALDIESYADKDRKNLVYTGKTVTEMRQVKVQLRADPANTDYYTEVIDLGGTDDQHKDIYIFYTVRNLKGVK